MVVRDRSVLKLMAAKSSCSNFLEQLSVCAEVIASQFWQNHRQIKDYGRVLNLSVSGCDQQSSTERIIEIRPHHL